MLYGMDDEELGLVKKEKLNIKKVILVIAIIIMGFLIVFFSSSISYKIINKDKTKISDVKQEQTESKDKKTEIKKGKKDKNEIIAYEGNHFQIAEHNVEMEIMPVQRDNAQQLIKDIYASDEKQVYLTFDDGPSRDVTPQILDILKENDVKATFFVLGARVELYPDTLKREFAEGHYIANHGYSHDYKRVYESKDTVYQEFVECENSIRGALGNPDFNTYLFRFPGGSSGGHYENIKAEARQLFLNYGVAYTNWNCLTGDAENKKTKEACIQEMLDTKGDKNSIILLMHDANDKQQTVDALPEIIQYYKNEGYTFKTFYEIFR